MSARSCLLCGRPLSRWTGTGDEFCSREHRNQYRLRRSMDRLQEANKVASVMRRRESPRPLQASRLINGGVQESRGFMDAMVGAPPPAVLPQLAPGRLPRMARMAPSGDIVSIPLRSPGSAQPSACPAPPPVRTTAPVILPLRVLWTTPGPRCAPPIRGVPSHASAEQSRRRLLWNAWQTALRPVRKPMPRIEPPRVYPAAESARPSSFGTASAAAKGRALRVSLSAGFRIPEWKLRPVLLHGPAATEMTWPGLRPLQSEPFGPAASASVAGLAPHDIMGVPELRIPAAPLPIHSTVFHWPEAMKISVNHKNPETTHRSNVIPFTTSEEYSLKERSYEYRD